MEKHLSYEQLSRWKLLMRRQTVEVFIPKFKMEAKYMMKQDLEAMGMPTAFTYKADFSGILTIDS